MEKRKCKVCGKEWNCNGKETNCYNLNRLDSCRCKTCWKIKYNGFNPESSKKECFPEWRIA